MTKPMEGVRVLEVALYAFVPAAGAVLAEWGAEVIKVEHPLRPDPMRGTAAWDIEPGTGGYTYMWEVANRGKRGIAVDIATPEGRELVLQLAEQADVFLTNFLTEARQKLGIDVEDVMERNPRIIYARGSGQGPVRAGRPAGRLRRAHVLVTGRYRRLAHPGGRRPPGAHGRARVR